MADKGPKGAAAPLEGAVGKEIMGVLNMAFSMIGLGMLAGLGMKVGAAPTLTSPTTGARPAAAAIPKSNFAAPAAPRMK